MKSFHILPTSCTTILLLFFLSLLISPLAQATSASSWAAYAPYSTYIDGQSFYIAGVGNSDATEPQAGFVIDLSVAWNTANPTAKAIEAQLNIPYVSSALSSDGKQWIVFDGTAAFYSFGILTSTWANFLENLASIGGIISAVIDQDTNVMYIPNFYEKNMLRLDLTTKAYVGVPMPDSLVPSRQFSLAWSASLHKLLFIGGTTGGTGEVARLNLYSYNEKDGWTDLAARITGQAPASRTGACFVPTNGGNTMILFGGFTSANATVHTDIWMLDVATMTWKQGPSVPPGGQRAEAACALSNNQFIAWGGRPGVNSRALNSTIVYNLNSNQWASGYTPSSPGAKPTDATPSTLSSGSDSTRTIIIVSVVLGVVVISVVAGGIIYRTRRRKASSNIHNTVSPPEEPSGDNSSTPARPIYRVHNPATYKSLSEEHASHFRRNPQQQQTNPLGYPPSQAHGPHAILPEKAFQSPQYWKPGTKPSLVQTATEVGSPQESRFGNSNKSVSDWTDASNSSKALYHGSIPASDSYTDMDSYARS